MMRIVFILMVALSWLASAQAAAPDLQTRLANAAPDLDPKVLALALQARQCAVDAHAAKAPARLAIIDYTRPSTQKRLWVFDLDRATLLFYEPVAHGRGSGGNIATGFSNVEGSLQSSLGLFQMAETYVGKNGYSLRLDGLEPGVNDHARERLLVMHGAAYVDLAHAQRQGRLGRSWGCPVVRTAVAHELIDSLKQGQLLFVYARDASWLDGSRFLHCGKPER